MDETTSPPIAVRQLHLVPSGRPVLVELHAPERRRGDAWVCAYRVQGLGRTRAGRVHGVDGLDALLRAVDALRRELEPFGPRLAWEGEPGDIGLPTVVPDFLGADFRRRVERLVRNEIDRETRELPRCIEPESGARP